VPEYSGSVEKSRFAAFRGFRHQITYDYLLSAAASAGIGILRFVVSIIIVGVLLANAASVIMEDVWSGKRIITIDLLGPEFLESVNTGDPIAIHSDGTVEIG
jgi:hypothetical protein